MKYRKKRERMIERREKENKGKITKKEKKKKT